MSASGAFSPSLERRLVCGAALDEESAGRVRLRAAAAAPEPSIRTRLLPCGVPIARLDALRTTQDGNHRARRQTMHSWLFLRRDRRDTIKLSARLACRARPPSASRKQAPKSMQSKAMGPRSLFCDEISSARAKSKVRKTGPVAPDRLEPVLERWRPDRVRPSNPVKGRRVTGMRRAS